jgi:DNA modification methylase
MAKIDITRTELVWPGKYNEDGMLKEVPRVSLPFQVIETVNESRATREVKKAGVQGGLFDVYEGKEGDTFEAGWRNKLIWGDNLLVMGSLLEKFAGKIDLIYIDPPFATGEDFSFVAQIGEDSGDIQKEPSLLEEKAYRDTWGERGEKYPNWLHQRLVLMRELLSNSGSICVHCDWHANAEIRGILNGVFGGDNFENEIVWWYYNKMQGNVGRFASNHDTIFWYSRSDQRPFAAQREEREVAKRQQKRVWDPSTKSLKQARDAEGNLMYYDETERTIDDVWRIPYLMPADKTENVGFQTQKPIELVGRLIDALCPEGGLVLDAFCGSGTTLVAAEGLRVSRAGSGKKSFHRAPLRRWIGCDLGRWGIHVTRKRLLGIENCKPFEVLNLGKYERQYWQGVTFGENKEKSLTEQALYEYLAFVLKLYGAQPVAGMAHLHGKKGKAMIHIGAVDAPVTIAEIDAAVDECAKLKQGELHVLGWEWEMGLYDLMVEAAKKRGVKLLLLQIPREVMEQQAAAKGDVRFFELAYLEAEIKRPKKFTVQVALKGFVIPNTELIPEDVRSKVKKWSDYIDYWAVDWDFRNDTFMQGWVAYRTRKERKLPLTSDAHAYEKPGRYRILVKVIDIFGNDTSQAFDVEVK